MNIILLLLKGLRNSVEVQVVLGSGSDGGANWNPRPQIMSSRYGNKQRITNRICLLKEPIIILLQYSIPLRIIIITQMQFIN